MTQSIVGLARVRARARAVALAFAGNVRASAGIQYALMAALTAVAIAGGTKILAPRLADVAHRISTSLSKGSILFVSEADRTSARKGPLAAAEEPGPGGRRRPAHVPATGGR